MIRPHHSLSRDALDIWKSGVAAVDSELLVRRHLNIDDGNLVCDDERIPLSTTSRIEVVGGGKAGAGMAAAAEQLLLTHLPSQRVSGWVNVPADCVRELRRIHLHAARPAGVNEPTADGVLGTREILKRVSNLGPDDICIVLISGGGSALMTAPIPEITLQDKLVVTRLMASGGAAIDELNLVRRHLSQIKGGGLLRHCRAGTVLTLIISDVIGDPLTVIASGPTVPSAAQPEEALKKLRKRASSPSDIPERVIRALEHGPTSQLPSGSQSGQRVLNQIIGNNRTAVHAAGEEARTRGFHCIDLGSSLEGEAADNGRLFESLTRKTENAAGKDTLEERIRRSFPDAIFDESARDDMRGYCLLSGGEPTVRLKGNSSGGKGGRNQELVLAAIAQAMDPSEWRYRTILSGGTDGEDGPTNAAGAVADDMVVGRACQQMLDPNRFLDTNDSYTFFEKAGGHLMTGPTHTNVMDLRVALMAKA